MIEFILSAAIAAVLAKMTKWKWWMVGALAGLAAVALDWSTFVGGLNLPWWWPSFIPWVPVITYTAILTTFAIGTAIGSVTYFALRRFLK
jgi:uncharacterized membrane protein